MTLSAVANPNNVLSAVAHVSFTPGVVLDGVRVAITDSKGADAGVTPRVALRSPADTVVPVLLLRPQSTYQFQALGEFDDGGTLASNTVSFTTQALPPEVPHYSVSDGGTYPRGYTLIGGQVPIPLQGPNTYYAAAVDQTGSPVWYLTLPVNREMCGDFYKEFDGTYFVAVEVPELTLPIQDRPGTFIQYDSLGNQIHEWKSPDGLATNEHEIQLLEDGTVLIEGFVTTPLSTMVDGGSPNVDVYASKLERVDPDGGVRWSWTELDHIPLSDIGPGDALTGAAVDPYHDNAFQVMNDGNYLLSINHMSQIVKIDSTSPTGDVIWILGGKAGQFTFLNDPLDGPSWQHGVRELPNGDIIMMDNGNYHSPPHSRAVEYALDLTDMTATMVWESERVPAINSPRFGNVQRLSCGETLVTYGEKDAPQVLSGVVDDLAPDGGVTWELTDNFVPIYPDGGAGLADLGIYRAVRIETVY